MFLQLIAAFNRGSLDVPDGFLTPHTVYSVNGQAYETLLGRSPDDTLIRLLARGAAGYRTAAKALQYALQNPEITVESVSEAPGALVAALRVNGRLRPDGEPFSRPFTVMMTTDQERLASMAVTCAPEDLERVRLARV